MRKHWGLIPASNTFALIFGKQVVWILIKTRLSRKKQEIKAQRNFQDKKYMLLSREVYI